MRIALLLLVMLSSAANATDYLIGEIKAKAEVNVMAQVDGLVNHYDVEFGEQVTQFQRLLAFDATDPKLELALAQANRDLAEVDSQLKAKQLTRLQQLNAKKTVTDSELEEQLRQTQISQVQLRVQQQNLAIAKRNLDKHTVHAPFAASVIERYVEVGQWVSVGEPLYRLADISTVLIQANLVEQDIAQLALGQAIKVYVPAIEKQFETSVIRLADAPQQDGSGYRIELELANLEGQLKPGYRAELRLEQGGVE
ncbi:efflux RND transporter periplasmic adaptor subunit [Shewanella maritima]|uniref:Efflux RND transporter periplasmic adaptor subunit n=1 Tax=Shewanella maritima TaxID=2520507 RepID=A0A411PHF0_9GAMM|nr:efflux RND transporter periplasmic adaptor subunit [Shewanella maritima]QBF83019.1 efflux RND transporter periplasmic adaptor subunit [Shewanella maritima]